MLKEIGILFEISLDPIFIVLKDLTIRIVHFNDDFVESLSYEMLGTFETIYLKGLRKTYDFGSYRR